MSGFVNVVDMENDPEDPINAARIAEAEFNLTVITNFFTMLGVELPETFKGLEKRIERMKKGETNAQESC